MGSHQQVELTIVHNMGGNRHIPETCLGQATLVEEWRLEPLRQQDHRRDQ